ncbi:MAG: N-6 DNA methylase [Anaerolineaceae bacterium]|jgi:type I restriction enzyme M protein
MTPKNNPSFDYEKNPENSDEMDSSESLAENQLYDYITNQPVKDTPVERLLQSVARSLVDEYDFDHTQLQRDHTVTYEVFNEHGKTSKVRRKIDIAVFAEGANREDQDKIIRVCIIQAPGTKAGDPRKGVYLLEEVLGGLKTCEYGLWTNGTDLVFKQKLTGDLRLEPEYDDLYDLPGNGETADDLDNPDRQVGRIATGDNLQRAFARVHDYIYGNQGLKKDAAFWQVLNLIFCKIHDERSTGQRRFWVKGTERNNPEGQAAIAKRIKELFEEVKQDPNYSSIFTERDQIELNDRVLAFAVGEFSRYTLLETDVDVKGAAYEEITSSMLKSQRGQFFTPTNVIRLMIEMMDPGGDADLTNENNWPRILDPACGSGRFLTYALDHIRRKLAAQLFPDEHPMLQILRMDRDPKYNSLAHDFAAKCLFGIDFDPDLKRAARMNMILNNDGHGNILSFNSLEFPLMVAERTLSELSGQYATHPIKDSTGSNDITDAVRARLDANLDTMDFVFTNPPFGAKIPIDDPRILKQFDLGHRWMKDEDRWVMKPELQARVAPEVLFVERCVQWVKPGTGKVAIVLPDGILGNPDAASIRYWILTHCQVLASVDLPVEAFLPQVGVQASLLFLRRKSQAEMDAEAMGTRPDYTVFMAVAEKVGHDRRGVTLYQRDADGAEIIFQGIRTSLRRSKNRQLPKTIDTPIQDKRVDDNLPLIGKAYKNFLKTGQNKE